MRILGILATALALSACGAINNEGSNKSSVSAEEAKAFSTQLPAVTIVRVPVDASGQENHDQAEMRTTNETSINDMNVVSVFDVSKNASATVDELDSSSSTEAFGWRRCCRKAARRACRAQACAPTNTYSYSYSESESYSSGYAPGNNWNWNMYTPTYYYGGYYYNWDYAQSYRNVGPYNYYRYNSSFNQNYNGYGWAN